VSTLQWMISIVDRAKLSKIIPLYESENLEANIIALGRGTVTSSMMSSLGLSYSEKAVCFSVTTDEKFKTIKKRLQQEIQIDVPGTGIVFISPLSSIGGIRELRYLSDGQDFEPGEESTMKDTTHELLVVICNQGYSDQVMEVARPKGAGGGTVIHSQGTGRKNAEQFLGIKLTSEKDILLSVVKTKQKKEIMETIMKEVGLGTAAKAICFSLPVTDTAGLRLIEEE